jgi:hypothetical protein
MLMRSRSDTSGGDDDMCRNDFTTLTPVLLQEHSTVVLLLKRTLVSWSLAMDERGGHEDLCGSGHRSVIPYAHERTEVVLLKPVLPEPAFLSARPIYQLTPLKWHLPEPFIAQGRTFTMSPEARQVASG